MLGENFHDWTFIKLECFWLEAVVLLVFKCAASKERVLTIENVREVILPRYEEWGASVSVMTADLSKDEKSGIQTIAIEMQSGDVIKVSGALIRLD